MTLVMGIVNVTPDSFSDGGLYLDPEEAIAHGRELQAAGADLVDVGGESTRPGAAAVGAAEEAARVLPVIAALAGAGARVSVDTSKAEVAAAAIDVGAEIVNDVTALGDPEMASVCAAAGCGLVLMHMKGTPRTMQDDPTYEDVVVEVRDFLAERLEAATAAGIDRERIWLDPGIGFGKTVEHNLELIAALEPIVALGRPVVIGASRKRFIGAITGRPTDERLGGSIAAAVVAAAGGAAVLRVHDVAATVEAVRVAESVLGREPLPARGAS
jgi:dihydropteroate synthase